MSSGDRLRPIVREVRQELVSGRQHLRQQHDRGLEGARVCARYTSLVDAAIGRIYQAYLSELGPAEAAQLRERVALVAHGGYGRRQQAPFSDVDLMILYEGKRDALVGQLASRLTQDICDVYQHLGHSVRTPSEAVQQARSDAQVGTSLLESRLLLGNSEVYGRFSDMMRALIEKRGASMAQDFVIERRKERLEYGETVYLLEPNVKRSRGGLRDIHLLRWLWFLKAGVADPDRLHDMGLCECGTKCTSTRTKHATPSAARSSCGSPNISNTQDARVSFPSSSSCATISIIRPTCGGCHTGWES
jgi:[protein-PII] uridylyltransferase